MKPMSYICCGFKKLVSEYTGFGTWFQNVNNLKGAVPVSPNLSGFSLHTKLTIKSR